MELRRALLLFAIVLGVAAVVAALANPPADDAGDERSETLPLAPPDDSRPAPTRVRFDSRGAATTERVRPGRATTVVVTVGEAGQVEVPDLGLTDSAEPGDPALFETLPGRGARHRVLFTPAGQTRPRLVGQLVSPPAN